VAVPQVKQKVFRGSDFSAPPPMDPNVIRAHARSLSEQLQAQRLRSAAPDSKKTLRKFSSGEVAKLLGVTDAYLRQIALDGKGPKPEVMLNGRRMYSLEEIHALRAFLSENAKSGRQYLKHRSGDEHLQIISCINFKGGSAKTTTAAHLAQYLALNGYRVLAIDLDPQASLTALHGCQPELEVKDNETIYGAIRYDAEAATHPRDIIRKTYIAGLDLVPGNLELMEFEHETPAALAARKVNGATADDTLMFFERLGAAIDEVADDYDVVAIDCPPQLGFLTMSALSASTSLLITVHPQMLDVMSMCQFLNMTADTLDVVKDAGANVTFNWARYLITRYEPNDVPQQQMVGFMRQMFGDYVCKNPMIKSTAISDAGVRKQTIYEVPRENFSKATYDRAVDAMNTVNSEIEDLIKKAWGRE